MDKLVINRKKWLTPDYVAKDTDGATYHPDTALLDLATGAMCCLGFLARACKIPSKAIACTTVPSDVTGYASRWPERVLNSIRTGDSAWTAKAVALNDDPGISPKQREEKLVKHFAKIGIALEFA